jgi:DtxR family Mn-dependent transcriptional regulator
MNDQIIIQDTLKRLAEWEHEGRTVSREALADELPLPREQVNDLLRDLESADLLEHNTLSLTQSGREYALHVLRAHRLYETYLAHKVGVSDDELHALADIEEHRLTAADLDQIARELDHPAFDPHGDPIPTASGAMAPKRGQPLTDYPVGWAGRVVHVEDEPPQLYKLIYSARIAPGTVLRIAEKDDRELRILMEGCSFSFPVDAAQQITVVSLMNGEHFDESLRRLSSLDEGEEVFVVGLSPLCRGLERNRLLDLGVVPGSAVSIDLVSPSGNPVAYRIRGASIALRKEQAELVLIRNEKEKAHGQA